MCTEDNYIIIIIFIIQWNTAVQSPEQSQLGPTSSVISIECIPRPGGNPLSNYPSRQTVGNDTGSSNDTGGKERVSVVFSFNEIGVEALRAFNVRGDVMSEGMCVCVRTCS